ncbi:hypothetical protein CRUP_003334 [Coryphaenoides rupestris]|nr:hypothetical protein CRUP_003334 [Coryphaenoides rupestris]
MAAFPCVCILFLLQAAWAPSASPYAHNAVEPTLTELAGGGLESSGGGPNEPPGGRLHLLHRRRHPPTKVLRLSSYLPAQSGILKRGGPPPALGGGGGGAPGPRMPFPAFLSRGRAGGPAVLHPPRVKEGPGGLEVRKRQGLRMWQQAVSKAEHRGKVSLVALSLKDARLQSCSAVPFTQRVRAEGCEEVTLRNKLCFGQCNSLFVPSGEEEEEEEGAGRARRGACSRCSPSRSHEVRVPLRCGSKGLLERRVMVVEECRCESGREEGGLGL